MPPVPIADLWLPWFVRRSDPSQPAVLPDGLDDAQQLRVRDISRPDVWEALSQADPANPQHLVHAERIEREQLRFADVVVIAVLPAYPVPEGLVLLDGCHRACALYRLDPAAEADVIVPPHIPAIAFHPMPRSTELS